MSWSILDVAEARRVVEALLEALPLEKYSYTLEPGNGGWNIVIEYSGPEGWQVESVRVDDGLLRESRDAHSAARRRLLDRWRNELLASGTDAGKD
jgi:hypothetical protein